MSEWRRHLAAALGPTPKDDAIRATGPEGVRRAVEVLAEHRVEWKPGRPAEDRCGVEVPAQDVLLDLWPEDLVARVSAGATFDQLDEALRPWNFSLAATAPRPDRTTLGAAFARGDRGFSAAAAGSLRELVLGLRAVDGVGRLHQGGARVVKNVAGYDLCRLHHGAAGSLGVVLDCVVKLEATPEVRRGVFVPTQFAAVAQGVAALRRPAARLDPSVLVWLNAPAAEKAGLDRTSGFFALAAGWRESIEAWVDSIPGARAASFDGVRDLGYVDPTDEVWRWAAGLRTALQSWPAWDASLRRAGVEAPLVLDIQTGGHRVVLPAGQAELREHVPQDVRVFPSTPGPHRGPWPDAARRLKQSLDPHDLLPPIPGSWP